MGDSHDKHTLERLPERAARREALAVRTVRWLVAALLLLGALGCAQRTDWIEGTLVTVDVSGVWTGTVVPGLEAGVGGDLQMTLVQRGAKVSGDGRFRATRMAIEGTVRGDVFSFSEPGGRFRGEATVTGDEMSGPGWTSFSTPLTGAIRR